MGCAPESLVPHDHDQPSERAEIVGHLLADPDVETVEGRSACMIVLSSLPRRKLSRLGVGVSGEGEGPTSGEGKGSSRRVSVGAADLGADEQVAVGHAVRVAQGDQGSGADCSVSSRLVA